MANTTNFGWETPDDTDLVKDGAAAMRTLGNAIDTSFVDLKGGTTGQILSKASNTDLDYTWVSPNPGDITAVTAGTGITGGGTSGDVTVSFDQANYGGGIGASGKNKIINGAFDIWQRGTSFPFVAGELYTADRWYVFRGGFVTGATISRQTSGLAGSRYCFRIQRDSGNTSTQPLYATYTMETQDSIGFAGQTIAFSFYARKGANYSGGDLTGRVLYGTGTDQRVTTFTGIQITSSIAATLSTSWTRYQATATVNSAATEIGFDFAYTPSGTAGAADYVEIGDVQFESGTIATPFQRYGGNVVTELAACQRYYWRANAAAANNVLSTMGTAYSTSGVAMSWQNPVPMRVKASSIDYSALELADFVTASTAITSATADGNSTTNYSLSIIGVAGTPLTQYRNYAVRGSSSSGYIGFNAEL